MELFVLFFFVQFVKYLYHINEFLCELAVVKDASVCHLVILDLYSLAELDYKVVTIKK